MQPTTQRSRKGWRMLWPAPGFKPVDSQSRVQCLKEWMALHILCDIACRISRTSWAWTFGQCTWQICCYEFQDVWQTRDLKCLKLGTEDILLLAYYLKVKHFFVQLSLHFHACLADSELFCVVSVRSGLPGSEIMSLTCLLVENSNTMCSCLVSTCLLRSVQKRKKKTESTDMNQ